MFAASMLGLFPAGSSQIKQTAFHVPKPAALEGDAAIQLMFSGD